ncbi:hypothetical protein I2485_13900 [Nesterenkonia sp. E16_7]|uniref:hypothetical protein n=1 Tax=unclassified Nesterenkonia TaxID=2629769 RepID=UPI001A923493|nr:MULTISPECIES: hypothetical protein [unclassified Nesterenkonia]MBO0596308.1 hypothetical protein [Nesterenkonia sp. E16_10]MBO0599737.1 hypothetical protein [Nesterenkonia sp. E16_7]
MANPERRAVIFILAVAVLGAVAVLLVPGLFEEFQAWRLVSIVVLLAAAIGFGIAARRNRRLLSE